ncbi:hypothetical protein BH23GEM3_BH23GEM3_05200 [soil metagenome]|nr:hypothetical protein [Gemmatimonadota bacterium]
MMPSEAPEAPVPPIPVADAWLGVSDDLLWGINHALSNRLAAVAAVVRILQFSDTGLDPLFSVLGQEITNLEKTIALLRLLPRNPDEQPEPVHLTDTLTSVLALHRLQSDGRDLEYEVDAAPDVLPVWIEPSTLAHALLLLLSSAARIAERAGNTSISVTCRGDEDWATLAIESPPPQPGAGEAEESEWDDSWKPVDARVVEVLLEGAGGELMESRFAGDPARGVCYRMRLPTLLAVRRTRNGI